MNHQEHIRREGFPIPWGHKGSHSDALTVLAYIVVFWILLPVVLFSLGFRLDVIWNIPFSRSFSGTFGGWTLSILGGSIVVASMAQLWYQGKGLPISDLPPDRFVSSGLYEIWRHPIYVGFTGLFAGVSWLLGSTWCLAFSTPLLLAMWLAYALYFEEPVLVKRFGSVYQHYTKSVPLLIPRIRKQAARIDSRSSGPRTVAWLNKLANHTILFQAGSLIVVTYGLFLSAGAVLMATVTSIALVQHGLTPTEAGTFVVIVAAAVGPGSWLFWWIGNFKQLKNMPHHGIGRIGFVSYGAVVTLVVVALVMARVLDIRAFLLLDSLFLGLYLAYTVGRIGCLTYGCCYGRETRARIGLVYESEHAKMIRLGDHRRICRHPVQLYSSLHGLLAFILLCSMTFATIPAGLLTAAGLLLGGLGRMFTESYRDREAPIAGRFTWGHLGSWVMCIAGCALLWIIPEQIGSDAPVPFDLGVFLSNPVLLGYVAAVGVIILVVYGVHWKHIGVWFE